MNIINLIFKINKFKTFKKLRGTDIDRDIANCHMNIGLTFKNQHYYDKALDKYKKCLDVNFANYNFKNRAIKLI